MKQTAFRLAITTTADPEEAERLGRDLVQRRLAACVNIVPAIKSVYRWEGKIASDDELLLLIKTRAELIPPLKAAIEAGHSYDCPELIVLDISDGSTPYLAWLAQSLPDPTDGD